MSEDGEMIKNPIETLFNFIRRRKYSYLNVFNPESMAGQEVLRDLAKFCRAKESCFHADPRVHAVLEGRRETYLRIINHLNLTDEQLYELYK